MFGYVMIGSNDLARSKKFYDALFGAMGGEPANVDAKGRLVYRHNGGTLMVTRPINGKPATAANGGTLGLTMRTPAEADACHKAGIENGGAGVEDPPGIRHGTNGTLYVGFLRDPDGNKLCMYHRVVET